MGGRAQPLRFDDFRALLAACPGTPLGMRDAALVTVMREGLLRAQEAALLSWDDVRRVDEPGHAAVIRIRRSKTNPAGLRAEAVTVSRHAAGRLDAWRPHAPRLLVFGLSARSVSGVLARAGLRAGIEGVSGHSCRRGMAQDMAAAGYSALVIQARGRWASLTSAQRYVAEIGGELGRPVPPECIA